MSCSLASLCPEELKLANASSPTRGHAQAGGSSLKDGCVGSLARGTGGGAT